MAGNKGNTKSKTKDDKTRLNKGPSTSNLNDDLEDCDLSLLRKPIQTSISSFAQARKIYDIATEELKNLLSDECDLLYECKVCKNIFRSVVNLLSHKRIYCKEKYNPSDHGKRTGNISLVNEVSKIKRIEEEYQESMKKLQSHEPREENRIPLTKDLTTVVEEITKVKGVPEKHIEEKMHNVTFQTIPSSKVAVFQNVNFNEDDLCTDMRSELTELQEILSKNKAVLQPGGKFSTESSMSSCKDSSEVENVIQISDDEETDESDKLKCKICNLQLSTQKTLKFHMKYKHLDSRLVYPCPDCFDIFATSWSVYRHLYKVHRKSAAQIRRQRESIQAKAFRMNNPPAYYEKKKNNMKAAAASKVTDVEKFDRDNQAWMDNMEGDGEVPRCGGCGRTFERRAALAAHTHTCQPRNRALARRPLDSKRIEIQIRKDYNKGPNQLAHNNDSSEALHTQVNTEDDMETNSVDHDLLKTSSKTQNLANNAKEGKLKSNNSEQNVEHDMETPDVLNAIVDDVKQLKAFNSTSKKDQNANVTVKDENRDIETLDNPNKNTTDMSDNLPDVKKESVIQETVSNSKISHNNLPFYKHVEENNIAGLKQKMEPDIDLNKLQCKKCFIKFIYMHELCFHMAHHYNWKRYSCKLCNFKHYLFDAVIEHNKIVHKLKGDREFYYTTVKALDSADAIDPNLVDDINDNTTNIDSRRPSRCSNDSSRSSDDSTTNNIRTEIITNKRKRKLPKSQYNAINKGDSPVTPKKGETSLSTKMPLDKVMEIILGEPETPPKSVSDQERSKDDNLSNIEDPTEKSTKRLTNEESILTTRVSRPIRKRIRPKNEDFEYDLSNLLKLEAQGYREQQVGVSSRTLQIKRKSQSEALNSEIAMFNVKDVSGVLLNMSRKAVEESRAHLKLITTTSPVVVCNNVCIKQRVTKTVPVYKTGTPNAIVSLQDSSSKTDSDICKPEGKTSEEKLDSNVSLPQSPSNAKSLIKKSDSVSEPVTDANEMLKEIPNEQSKTSETSDNKTDIKIKNSVTPNSGNARPLVCQSVVNPNEVLKNPLVSQNITEFAKAGMTTKFVLIKPVNRDLASQDIASRPLKLKTIKIKDLETKTKVSTLEQMKFLKIASGDSSTTSKEKTDVIDFDKKKQEIARKQNITSKILETDNST